MKKTAIAVAVAAVLAAPVAMADVSVSGQLQTQIVNYGGDGGNRNGLYVSDGGAVGGSNSGNWGAINLVASEDLGDGMKALAKYSFNVLTGANIGTREAYVGLAGGFGAVLGGKLNHPYKTSTVSWDPFLSTFAQARFNGGMGGGLSGDATANTLQNALYGSEVDNALAYAGSFGGVKVVAALIVDEGASPTDTSKTNGKNGVSFSVNAPVGPVEVAVAYANLSELADFNGTSLATVKDLVATKVGVKWVSGDITVAGQYEMLDKGFSAQAEKGSVAYVTGSYKMGNNTVSAAYGMTDKKLNTVGTDKAATYLAVGLNHAMSKNTSAFVGYRSSDNGTIKENAVGAGLRVKF